MAGEEPFLSVLENREPLTSVYGNCWGRDEPGLEMLVALQLQFEEETITLCAHEDDSIEILKTESDGRNAELDLVDLSGSAPRGTAIGRPLLFAWTMHNQIGYVDGVQLHFAEDVEDDGIQLQLIVFASCFKTTVVE